jgi:hypothetical protein
MSRIWAALLLAAVGVSSAQAVVSARLTAGPLPGEPLRAGSITTLGFAVDEEIDEMEVLLSLEGGRTFTVRVTREMSRGAHEITWRVPNLPTTRARLALRVGSEEEGEVIRDVSEEFTILAAPTEPLEDVRVFQGEWRAGEALEETPVTAPFDVPGLGEPSESIRALQHRTRFARRNGAAAIGAPPEDDPEMVEPIPPGLASAPASPRVPLNVPRRE